MKVNIGPYVKNEERKISVKLISEDTWSMDATLAYIVVPLLKQLKKETHGYPSEFINDGNIPEDYDNKWGDYEDGNGPDRWDAILDKMIWSFEQAKEQYSLVLDKTALDKKNKLENWMEEQEKYMKRVQEGFDLFGKYYMNLWD